MFFLQKGIISLKNLKYLEVLDIRMNQISPKIVKQGLCTEIRSSLLRVCLPKTTFKVKDLESLLEIAPNLNHLCIKWYNREDIEVRNTKSIFFSSKSHLLLNLIKINSDF